MSTTTKVRRRPGAVFTLGVMLSALGVAAAGLLCCSVPFLVAAGGRRSAGNAEPESDCCGPAGTADPQTFRMHQEGRDSVSGVPEQPHLNPGTVLAARDVRCCP